MVNGCFDRVQRLRDPLGQTAAMRIVQHADQERHYLEQTTQVRVKLETTTNN